MKRRNFLGTIAAAIVSPMASKAPKQEVEVLVPSLAKLIKPMAPVPFMASGFYPLKDMRDHWTCACGSGLCVQAGKRPESSQHVLWDGTVCGDYELKEANVDCFGEGEEDPS